MRKLLIILGVPIDNLTMDEALNRIEEFIEIGRKTGKTHQIATVNADFAVKASHDPELRYLLQESDMATADGMPLVWGARLLGMPVPERVTGADMVPALAERAAKKGYTVYMLGAAPGIAVRAAEILTNRHPGLQVVGTVSPPYGSILEMDRAIIDDIKEKRPDILLVALGNPKQEKWIGMYGREVGSPVAIGIGGTLDFIAGQTKRAPEWMQKSGTEWIYRLFQEPKRMWKRYVNDLVGFSSFFTRQWLLMRQGGNQQPVLPKSDLIVFENKAIISLEGRIDFNNYTNVTQKGQLALQETPFLDFDLTNATFLDSSAMGALVALAKQARDGGGDLRLINVPPIIYRALKLLKLDRFFDIIAAGDNDKATESDTADQPKSEKTANKWLVVPIPKRFDATTSSEILELCSQKLGENPNMILDFAETKFLASAGLAIMAQLNRTAQDKNGAIRLANCSPDVTRVIEMVKFNTIFPMFSDIPAAMR